MKTFPLLNIYLAADITSILDEMEIEVSVSNQMIKDLPPRLRSNLKDILEAYLKIVSEDV